jgi:hypothetical protein
MNLMAHYNQSDGSQVIITNCKATDKAMAPHGRHCLMAM